MNFGEGAVISTDGSSILSIDNSAQIQNITSSKNVSGWFYNKAFQPFQLGSDISRRVGYAGYECPWFLNTTIPEHDIPIPCCPSGQIRKSCSAEKSTCTSTDGIWVLDTLHTNDHRKYTNCLWHEGSHPASGKCVKCGPLSTAGVCTFCYGPPQA